MKKVYKVEIFKTGQHREDDIVYTDNHLKEMAETYNADVHEAPIVIGHENDQAWHRNVSRSTQLSNGWVVKPYAEGDTLYADIELDEDTVEAIKGKKLKKRSIGLYRPDSSNNPTPGKWSIRHLALLGTEPPQVKGLKDITIYSEDIGELFEEEAAVVYSEVFGNVDRKSLMEYNRVKDYQEKLGLKTFLEARRMIDRP